MNTPHTNTPPGATETSARNDEQSYIIVLRVLIPHPFYPLTFSFPSVSYIPMRILGEAARLELAAHEITTEANGLGTLNTGLLTLKVANIHAALPHVLDLLKRMELLQWSAVYWYDTREEFFRPVHIGQHIAPQPQFGVEELKEQQEAYAREILIAQKMAQFVIQKHAAQPPPPADPSATGNAS